MSRESKLSFLTFIICAGFFAAVFFHYFLGVYLGFTFPLNTFLPGPVTNLESLFGDWTGAVSAWPANKFNGVGLAFSYFPAAYLLFNFFSKLPGYFGTVVLPMIIFAVFSFVWTYHQLRVQSVYESLKNAIIGCLMCYPFLFTMQTGNAEGFVFISLCLFMSFHIQNKPGWAAFFLAVPIAMKLVAGVLLFLLLMEKKYREAAYTMVWIAVLTLASLIIFDGGLLDGPSGYFERLRLSQKAYSDLMIVGDGGNHWGHSILTMVRILWAGELPEPKSLLLPWAIAAGIIFLGILYLTNQQSELWKRVTLLICAMNLLPYTSTDYKLMHLWIPIALFINQKPRPGRLDWLFTLLFGASLIPKNYTYFADFPKYSLSCVLGPILLMAICILILYTTVRNDEVLVHEH